MANDNDEVYVPEDWDDLEFDIYDDLMRGMPIEALNDTELQDLFNEALFSGLPHLGDKYDELKLYLWDEYGIDFNEDFDWDSYREWYDSQ